MYSRVKTTEFLDILLVILGSFNKWEKLEITK